MAVNNKLAYPLMHITTGDYTQFTGKYLAGRSYRQPIESLPDKNSFSSGIEMFFDNSSADAKKVYSMFLANIIWKNNKLILTPEPQAVNSLATLKLIEAILGRVIYENLNAASVGNAIKQLITTAYAANPQNHPILTVKFQSSTKTIKKQLDDAPDAAARTQIINNIGNGFVGSVPGKLLVNPGDYLGDADAFLASDVLPPVAGRPAWFKAIADADRARRVTIVTKDVGKQVINPFYYLHKYSATQNVITISKASHPLMQGVAPTYGRESINGTYMFPIGWMNDFHKFPNSDPDSLANISAATTTIKEWKYDDAGKFAVNDSAFVIASGPTAQAKFVKLKNSHFTYLNTYCGKAQVPLELMFAQLGAETDGEEGAVAVRLEPLKIENETAIADATLERKYQKLIGVHCKALGVTKVGNNYRFLVEHTEQTPKYGPSTKLKVRVPMKLYFQKDKYFVIRKETIANDLPTITASSEKKVGGMLGTQVAGKKLFYPYHKQTAGKSTSAEVEKEVTGNCFFAFNPEVLKLVPTKPTLNKNTTVTVYLNGVETDLTFVLGPQQQLIQDLSMYEKMIWLAPGDKLSVCIETEAGTGDIKNLKLPFIFNRKYEIQINTVDNATNSFFNLIQKTTGGMPAAEELPGATTKYYALGAATAGKDKKEDVIPFKMPSSGYILLHNIKRVSNTLTKAAKVTVLKRATASASYEPTAIVVDIKADKLNIPISVPVLKDEEVILEITTQTEPPPTKKIKGLTVEFSFVPFDSSQSFFTSRNGYSFNLAALDRSDPTKPVFNLNGRDITWNDLYEVIDRTEGKRISIGPNQFLINTARESANAAKHFLDEMSIPPFPAQPRAYVDILSDPTKSLALGAADARVHYNFSPLPDNSETLSTCFDSPLVCSVHNSRRKDQKVIAGSNEWGLFFADANSYMKNSASMLNQAQDHYNETDCKPTVRFKK